MDLRGADLPRGDTPLDLRVGVGQALLVVPRDVCVASTADVGAGHVDVLGRESDGVDVDWEDSRRARTGGRRVVVRADVGVGQFAVSHRRDFDGFERRDHGPFGGRSDGDGNGTAGNTACTAAGDRAGA